MYRYNLVEKVESVERGINKVLIAWRAYGNMYHGARTFISQMTRMVGTEPVETSNGNTALLPTYKVRLVCLSLISLSLSLYLLLMHMNIVRVFVNILCNHIAIISAYL